MVKGDMIITSPVSENYLIFTTSERLDAYRLSGLAKAGQLVKLVDLSTNKYKLYILETDASATGGLKYTEILRRDTYDNTKVKYMILGENDDLPQEGDEKTDYYKLENNNYIHYRWIDNDYEIISGNSYSKIESDNRYTKTSSGNVPTTSTVGNPGDVIKANDALYECFGTNGTYYIWKKISFGGGAAFTSEAALRDAIIAGDITAGMSISLLENGKYKNYIIQTVNTTTGAYTKTQSGGGEVVTDVIYSDEDLSEYSSVNSTSGANQACVVIAPNEVDPYFLKSAQVKTKAGTPVKFSVFGISNFYPQDSTNRKRFTKVKDIAVINADDNGVARIEFDLPMRLIPDETVLVASCDTSQSSFEYGPYKDAQHTIFNYQSSWFDFQPGESNSWPFVYQTSGYSPYFVLEYVLVSNTTEIKKSAAEILQEQEYFSPYDNFVSDTSTNAVQNNAIYPFIISKNENVVNDGETTYLSAGKYNVDSTANCFAISCEAPTYGTYSVSSIEVRAANDAVITFGLWEMRFIQNGRGYWNLKQVLGTVTAANTRAKLTFQTPIVVDSSNQVIIATCPEKKIAYRSAASSPNPWKYNRIASSVFWYNNNSFSNAQVGDEVDLLIYIGVYKGWDYRENNLDTGAYEITYTPTVPEILTETRTLETCVNGLLSPIGSLRNKVWYCAGDSTTYGIEEGRSYAQIIAERNGMELWKDGISGTVMTSYPDMKQISAFSFDRYLNIPENVDFVTLWFGINDSTMGYPVGELDSDDPATFCGAYNKVLTWIINNRPNARVGLVVTHRATGSIKNAIRNLAKKYGLSTFDITNDPSIPFWHPQESYGASDVSESVKTLRTSQWWYESNNCVHPLTAGYEAISYPFESWLRSL